MKMPDWVYSNIENYTNSLIPKNISTKYTLDKIKSFLEEKYDVPFKVWTSDGLAYAERLGKLNEHPRRS